MTFKLFDYLDWKIPLNISSMEEKKIISENVELFSYYAYLNKFVTGHEAFAVIEKSILIQGYLNKKQIEQEADLYSDTELQNEEIYNSIHDRLPYFVHNGIKIYVPFFSPAFNKRYDTKVSSLSKYPFNLLKKDFGDELVNPFELYNKELFSSPFSRLIYITEDNTTLAYYHAELKCLFIINKQGTLDQIIPLFDEYIVLPDYTNIFSRLKDLLTYFYNYDRQGFIDALKRNSFISEYLYRDIIQRSLKTTAKRISKSNGK